MEKIIVDGGHALEGRVKIDGMKNAAVAIMFASIVTGGICVIENLPNINDVSVALDILKSVGATVRRLDKNTAEIDASTVKNVSAPDELVRKMRASYYLAGAMLGKFGNVVIGLPGGCDFGARPVDQHIKAFRALGAAADADGEHITAKAENGLSGSVIYFDCVTVGGTINAMIAAVCANGDTVIYNAAREPHIVDLANFLNTCGARISGAGTNVIKIRGGASLHGCTYDIIPDMLEAGAYMVAAAATHGSVYVDGVIPKHLSSISAKLSEMGADVEEFDDGVLVSAPGNLKSTNIKTLPYPGFPTDMQPLMAVLLCLSDGEGEIYETIYENRFRYAEELKRMGAQVKVDGRRATFYGGTLHPASVRAVDLRAGAAMIIAALAANGRTEIDDIYHVERGYSDIIGKLKSLGAMIKKIDYTNV
ncbi:MAG: UDP-N-acetylglucosamine 1-carboxyvinyltransferase [Clostridiales bacterium]|nr:UDP-N-acetylglucosamine 1-carboxyvinyltransferase [Clostridiales bacterium]